MKITLVNPPYPPSVHSHPPFIPLGIAYLGAVAENAGHEVTVIDCQAEKLNYEAFRSRISQTPSDIIGVTATTLLYKSAMHLIIIAKEVQPQAVTVLGGSHGTFWDENALNEYPSLDIVVRREGEQTFLELLGKLQNNASLNSVLGITFRNKDGTITRTIDRPFLENLDSLPFPAHHLLPLDSLKRMGKILFPLSQVVAASTGVTSAVLCVCSAEDIACVAQRTWLTRCNLCTTSTALTKLRFTMTLSQLTVTE